MVSIDQLNDPPDTDRIPAGSPDVVPLDEAGRLLETLSSDKRRAILAVLGEEPTNAAELAERVGTSVQNVAYHIRKLRAAGLVEVVGTHYSSKGLEMDLYAPTSPAIVIDVGDSEPCATEDTPASTPTGSPARGTTPRTLTPDG